MFYLRQSKRALTISSAFLFLATLALALHLYSMHTDPNDTGTSAVFLVLFTFPWMQLIPDSWVASDNWTWLVYPLTIIIILGNAFLLYLLTGGLGMRRS